jgi:hypothetical protein
MVAPSITTSAIVLPITGGYIMPEQADQFHRDGVLGSHLEILERNDGLLGFNQRG